MPVVTFSYAETWKCSPCSKIRYFIMFIECELWMDVYHVKYDDCVGGEGDHTPHDSIHPKEIPPHHQHSVTILS